MQSIAPGGKLRELPKVAEDTPLMPPAKTANTTSLPNWLMPIIIGAFIALIGLAYTAIDRRVDEARQDYREKIDKLERRIEVQETYMKNSRELLIKHGWDVSDDGKITRRETTGRR